LYVVFAKTADSAASADSAGVAVVNNRRAKGVSVFRNRAGGIAVQPQ